MKLMDSSTDYKKFCPELKEFCRADLMNYAKGVTFLGCGGAMGFSLDAGLAIAVEQLKIRPTEIISVEDLKNDELVVPLCVLGASLLFDEFPPTPKQFSELFKRIEDEYQKKISAVLPMGISGMNALLPFLFANEIGKKIVNADLAGRVFPHVSMTSLNYHGCMLGVSFISDMFGNVSRIEADDYYRLGMYSKKISEGMGGVAIFAITAITGKALKKIALRGSISRAVYIGEVFSDKTTTIEEKMEKLGGTIHVSGMIKEHLFNLVEGNMYGGSFIDGADGREYTLYFKNEYFSLGNGDESIAYAPDIIGVIDADTHEPLPLLMIQEEMDVHVVSIKCDDMWFSGRGMTVLSGAYFTVKDAEHLKFLEYRNYQPFDEEVEENQTDALK